MKAKEPAEERPRQILGAGVIIRKMLQDRIILGMLVAFPFNCLMLAGSEVMDTSPEKGSQRERIGSMMKDLGLLGTNASICFISLPAMALKVWRMKQGRDLIRLFWYAPATCFASPSVIVHAIFSIYELAVASTLEQFLLCCHHFIKCNSVTPLVANFI